MQGHLAAQTHRSRVESVTTLFADVQVFDGESETLQEGPVVVRDGLFMLMQRRVIEGLATSGLKG